MGFEGNPGENKRGQEEHIIQQDGMSSHLGV